MSITADPLLKGIYTYPYVFFDNIFSPEQLDNICSYCSQKPMEQGTVGVERNVNEKIRKSTISFHSLDNNNEWLFSTLLDWSDKINQQFYNFDLFGFNSFQYTEYKKNDHYDWHTDLAYGLNLQDVSSYVPNKLSFSLILSDPSDYKGGELEFGVGGKQSCVDQPRGRLIGFPSWVPHRVNPIIEGIRKSLVFWVIGPKFK